MYQIFFDIDGSLITPNYRINVELQYLQRIIGEAKQKGFVLNLNSNRSLEGILKIRDEFNLNGFIIYENGCGVFDPTSGVNESSSLPEINRNMLASHLKNSGFNAVFVNTDQLIKDSNRFLDFLQDGQVSVFCEASRKFSATLYPRKLTASNKVEVDSLDSILSLLSEKYKGEYTLIENYTYGNLSITLKQTEKGSNLDTIAKDMPIASFGDEIADISMFIKSDICGCPSNASEEVKLEVQKRKGYIAKSPYTQGACEFIRYLLDYGK